MLLERESSLNRSDRFVPPELDTNFRGYGGDYIATPADGELGRLPALLRWNSEMCPYFIAYERESIIQDFTGNLDAFRA